MEPTPVTVPGRTDVAPPALTPYIAVPDGRAALDWYAAVFGGRPHGQVYVMPDGSIGHAELRIADSVLMLAEGTGVATVAAPEPGQPATVTLHLRVADVEAVLAVARERGAAIEREPRDEPYGRVAVLVDPFGHRWMLNGPVR